jgi:hypothetical protein
MSTLHVQKEYARPANVSSVTPTLPKAISRRLRATTVEIGTPVEHVKRGLNTLQPMHWNPEAATVGELGFADDPAFPPVLLHGH